MHPIEDFVACCQFLQEIGKMFLEAKEKEVKHGIAGLLSEILIHVAAAVKNEVNFNVPALQQFVELLYNNTLDLCTKRKHVLVSFLFLLFIILHTYRSVKFQLFFH